MHKILIVDDEIEIVKVLEEFLVQNGFKVITALNGEEAIGVLKTNKEIDLMLLDRKMPGKDGTDVLKYLKEIDGTFPVIMMTGSFSIAQAGSILEKFGYNRNDIIVKPTDLYQLLEKVKNKLQ